MNATDLDATFESFPGGSPSPAALRLLVANADAWAERWLRDGEGRPQIEFVPGDHCAPEEWRKVKIYWRTLGAARKLGGAAPLF